MFGTLPAYGFFCRHVKGLTFRDVVLQLEGKDARPALICDDVQRLDVHGLQADVAKEGPAVMALHNVRGAMIQGCTAPAASAFLRVMDRSSGVNLIGNDLARAAKPFDIGPDQPASAVYATHNRGN